jgi:hypothetical protein
MMKAKHMKIQTVVTTLALVSTALPALALQFPDPVRPLVKGEPGYELPQARHVTDKSDDMKDCTMMKGEPCKHDCMKTHKEKAGS